MNPGMASVSRVISPFTGSVETMTPRMWYCFTPFAEAEAAVVGAGDSWHPQARARMPASNAVENPEEKRMYAQFTLELSSRKRNADRGRDRAVVRFGSDDSDGERARGALAPARVWAAAARGGAANLG